jgi:hypothetical protein
MAESIIKLEVIVLLICFSSILVERVSDTRMRVPSERTTFSRGVIRKANGSLLSVSR